MDENSSSITESRESGHPLRGGMRHAIDSSHPPWYPELQDNRGKTTTWWLTTQPRLQEGSRSFETCRSGSYVISKSMMSPDLIVDLCTCQNQTLKSQPWKQLSTKKPKTVDGQISWSRDQQMRRSCLLQDDKRNAETKERKNKKITGGRSAKQGPAPKCAPLICKNHVLKSNTFVVKPECAFRTMVVEIPLAWKSDFLGYGNPGTGIEN